MDAILYVCHGSRVQSAVHSAIHFVNQVINNIKCEIQEISFIELAKPSIIEGLEKCVLRGATSVTVLPVLLLSANHAKIDIPNEIEAFLKRHPEMKVTLAHPIGVHENMIKLVKKRIFEKISSLDDSARILFVGRGSSDSLTQRDFLTISNLLEHELKRKVTSAYMAVSKPTIHEAWHFLLSEENTNQTIVVPYLFFSGTLMSELQDKINHLPLTLQKKWILCETLGYDQLITAIFKDRIKRVTKKPLSLS